MAILSTSCNTKNDVAVKCASLPESENQQISEISSSSESIPSSENESSDKSNHSEIFSMADYVATSTDGLYDIADIVISGSFKENISTYVNESSFIMTESAINVNKVFKGEYLEESIKIN